ncbi:MAG: sulfatase-like hydrolase/transferase [Kiritimatiellae bacterium]|nr:sulfatase-like hydrolase/transferase [Kiritimatiellia bacterium]
MNPTMSSGAGSMSRRRFLKCGAAGSMALLAGARAGAVARARATPGRPNILFVSTDQQHLNTIAAHGCRGIRTPNLDRLACRGVSFTQSYSTNPLCSPARSSWFTGRMPSETGVVVNGKPIRRGMPTLGHWLREAGYETPFVGKWHLPGAWPAQIDGFDVIPAGINGLGTIGDTAISRACQGYLRNRKKAKPFLLTCSFLQPHDVCQFVSMHRSAADEIPYAGLEPQLPPLPVNFNFDPNEPAMLRKRTRTPWTERQWRYYIWNYYRLVEMVDAEIGRVLEALDDGGEAANTLVIFTSDHGEGCGCHQMVLKNYLYDEAAAVPFIAAFPGRIAEGQTDRTHLVSGLDIVSTICDYAGVKPPPGVLGCSLKPLLEGGTPTWREFVAAEVRVTGRMIRTPDYKYIAYTDDPAVQLFDMKNDPGETKNLAEDSRYAQELAAHRKLLAEWEARLQPAPGT